MKNRISFIIFLLTVIIVLLSGCQTTIPENTATTNTDKTVITNKPSEPTNLIQSLNQQLHNEKIVVMQKTRYISITLPSYYTFTTKNKIRNTFKIYLDIIAHNLAKYTFTKLIVAGYTDNFGSLLTNEKLSRTWATNIAHYLIAKNISRNKITIEANGEYAPIASNYTLAGRMRNKRAEIHIYQ